MVGTKTAHSPIGKRPRVVIIGAGVVGLGIAWRLACPRRGFAVRPRQGRRRREPCRGRHAGGLRRSRARRRGSGRARPRQPGALAGFCRGAVAASGIDVELRREGTLVLALTADDQATLAHHLEFQQKLGLPLEWLSAAATRAKEPHLAGKIAGSVFSPQDHQVDNRKLSAALRIAAEAAGAKIHEHQAVKEISVQGGRATGVVLEDGTQRCGRSRGARRRRLVAQHRRTAARSPAAGAPDQGSDVGAAHGLRLRRSSITCCGRRAPIWCRAATAA